MIAVVGNESVATSIAISSGNAIVYRINKRITFVAQLRVKQIKNSAAALMQ